MSAFNHASITPSFHSSSLSISLPPTDCLIWKFIKGITLSKQVTYSSEILLEPLSPL